MPGLAGVFAIGFALAAAPPQEALSSEGAEATPTSNQAEGPSPAEASETMSPSEHAEHRRNYRTVVWGDVATGLGVGGFIAMVAGLALQSQAAQTADRQRLRDEPDPETLARATRNTAVGQGMAIGGGVAAVVLIASGVTMIAVGTRRETRRRARVSAGPAGVALRF